MASLTELMEKMSAQLPGGGGGNQSTATCAYYTATNTLYITHQKNLSYESILVAPGTRPTMNVFGGFKKLRIGQVHPNIQRWLAQIGESLPSEGDWRAFFGGFMRSMQGVKVVLNDDLFVTRNVSTSGLHGESRIIRHLFLKYLRRTEDADVLSSTFSKGSVTALERKFREHFGEKLHFGSSQGACSYCGDYMTKLGIKWTTPQDRNKKRDDSWVHPITMTTEEAGFGKPATDRLYAPSTAEKRREMKPDVVPMDTDD